MSAGDKDRSAEFPNLAKRVFSDPGRSRRRISLSETAIRPLSLCGIRYSNKSSRSEPVSEQGCFASASSADYVGLASRRALAILFAVRLGKVSLLRVLPTRYLAGVG